MKKILGICLLSALTSCGIQEENKNVTPIHEQKASQNAEASNKDNYTTLLNEHGPYRFNHNNRRYSYRNRRAAQVIIIQQDPEYLRILRAQAEAALIKARAEARKSDAKVATIRAHEARLERAISELNFELEKLKREVSKISSDEANINKLFYDGISGKSQISSLYNIMKVAGIRLSEIRNIEVSALSEDNFVSAGKWQVIDGKIVKGSEVTGFDGGNMISYLEFLKTNNQNINVSSDAMAELSELEELVNIRLDETLEEIVKESSKIKDEKKSRYKDIEKIIKQYD